MSEPQYGQSDHYIGQQGQAYFAYQKVSGLQGGPIEARTKFAAHVKKTDTVIDFGCGSGAVLASLDCARRIGVEINPAAREVAAQNGVEVYATLDEIPDGVAQVVISNHALEHVPYPLQALRELRHKLAPGGRLILVVPIDDWRVERQVNVNDVNRHFYTWTPLLLGNLLDEAGYRVERVRIFTHAWPPHWKRLSRSLPAWLFDAICGVYSVVKRRRQIIAEATRID